MFREFLNSSSLTVAADTAPTLVSTPGIGGGDVLGVGISMFIVVAVIIVLGWLYSRSRIVGGGGSGVINVVASRALGHKERLLVVEVAGQQLLVGMTATAVQTLHVFEKPVSVSEETGKAMGFAGRLHKAVQDIGK
jgi:flagellar protein FliO/FliZ